MDKNIVILATLVALNSPLFFFFGWVLFRSWGDFWEAIRYWFTPEVFSMFRGELMEDWWAEAKLGILVALSAICVLGEYYLIGRFLL